MVSRKIPIQLLKLIVTIFLSLVILSGVCLGYNYSGCHITNVDGSTDYKWEKSQYFSTMKEGFSWFRFDRNGYNNVDDSSFLNRPVDILLVGSSHMEAVQIPRQKNVGYLLNKQLPGLRTYNIGISGHNIYTCVSNLKAATGIYKPQKLVILETDIVHLDVKSMDDVLTRKYKKIKSRDNGLVYKIQKTIPSIKTLYKAINEWLDVSKQNNKKKDNNILLRENERYKDVLGNFLRMAKESVPEKYRVIIFYHPSAVIDIHEVYNDNDDSENKRLFAEMCEKNNIVFVDMTNDFREMYLSRHVFAHGFINTAVGVGHLNVFGHELIAECLTKTIKELYRGSFEK